MISEELAPYYSIILSIIFTIISIVLYFQYLPRKANYIIYKKNSNNLFFLILSILVIIFIGFRPLSGSFGDMITYSYLFKYPELIQENGDWLFYKMLLFFSEQGTLSSFFLIISIGYIGFTYWGFLKIFKNNLGAALILFFSAFSFASYGVNGIRNGFASSMFLLGLCWFIQNKSLRDNAIGLSICFVSVFFHKSLALPLVCLATSCIIRNYRLALTFWLLSIILFLVAKGMIESLFISLGFDDRLETYITEADEYASKGFKTGLRLDFLLYSAMPILLGYIVEVKHHIIDRSFSILMNTYIFSNAFWCMLMGAAFSNRFAYLSWFLYPIVLAYPCLKLNVWGSKQGKVLGTIILINALFTLFMVTVYY